MTEQTNTESLYEWIDQMAGAVQKNMGLTYLEALAEAGENLLQQEVVQSLPDEKKEQLQEKLKTDLPPEMKREEIRKAFQLAVIKGMKENVQPHHAMTPDAVAMFMGYLAEKLTAKKEVKTVMDPAVGTANLLTAVLNQLSKEVVAYGAEVDETLLNIAYVLSNLQEHTVELFHQDSIEKLPEVPADLIVADLPVGYYPKAEAAEPFELNVTEDQPYVHHLMIESSLKELKENGTLLLLVPNFIFESDQADELQRVIKKYAFTIGLLQLPSSMFKDQQFAKSIWIIQKRGPNVRQPGQALLAEMPSFSNREAMIEMMKSIDNWFKEEGFS